MRVRAADSAGTYAAVHLGEDCVSVLVSSAAGVQCTRFDIALTMDEGTLLFLRSDPPDVAAEHAAAVSETERRPWSFVDDEAVLVGSTVVPTARVFGGIVGDALARSGVVGHVDLLELACPSAWGDARRDVVRRAVRSSAGEVTVIDSATAVVRSLGERAPESAVVVEVDDLSSVVVGLDRRRDEPGVDGQPHGYVRDVRWDAVGSRDIDVDAAASRSVLDRVAALVAAEPRRGRVDVFVLSTTGDEPVLPGLTGPGVGEPASDDLHAYRIHRATGPTVVRSMAAAVGLSDPGDAPGDSYRSADAGSAYVPAADTPDWASPFAADIYAAGVRGEVGAGDFRADPTVHPPVPLGRAAAWLTEATAPSPPTRRVSAPAVGALALVLLLGGLVFFVFRAEKPVPSAQPVSAQPASSRPVPAVAPTSEPPVAGSSTRAAERSTPVSTPNSTPDPVSRSEFGRVSIAGPATWTTRSEQTRILLIPPDFPERRIVLSSTELTPGASLDSVAEDLQRQLDARSDDGSIVEFTAATDFGERVGISYVENPPDGSTVQWHVFVDGGLQVSIGCQSSAGFADALIDDCARAVSSLSVSPAR
ncbi:type VII secretion-associated protein [Rhodococcus sp. 14-2470-1a]|uniref:type VII secretion-associated protein n=1 Tax=Rhodococcus sp. 14-2470-1a TaxID=2023150 RepID=UPI000B9A8ACF|nr:type VII secretion-associated protein [Rhodococcus sp. 14-2470-1a]OZF57421.1 type VII secretion-associated protein [Rhodococcus sp. 14-2470-1a]